MPPSGEKRHQPYGFVSGWGHSAQAKLRNGRPEESTAAALLALVGLLAAAVLHLVIGVSVPERLSLPVCEAVLGAGIAFYFGARS